MLSSHPGGYWLASAIYWEENGIVYGCANCRMHGQLGEWHEPERHTYVQLPDGSTYELLTDRYVVWGLAANWCWEAERGDLDGDRWKDGLEAAVEFVIGQGIEVLAMRRTRPKIS